MGVNTLSDIPAPRIAKVVVNELRSLYPEIEGDLIFTVRCLSERELFGIRAIQDDLDHWPYKEILDKAGDPDFKYHVEIVSTGLINPRCDTFFALRLLRDFRPVFLRLSKEILAITEPDMALGSLSTLFRLH